MAHHKSRQTEASGLYASASEPAIDAYATGGSDKEPTRKPEKESPRDSQESPESPGESARVSEVEQDPGPNPKSASDPNYESDHVSNPVSVPTTSPESAGSNPESPESNPESAESNPESAESNPESAESAAESAESAAESPESAAESTSGATPNNSAKHSPAKGNHDNHNPHLIDSQETPTHMEDAQHKARGHETQKHSDSRGASIGTEPSGARDVSESSNLIESRDHSESTQENQADDALLRTPSKSSMAKKAHPKKHHGRLQSHAKVPARTPGTASKPNLNRSKSTDAISRNSRPSIRRNNRSHNKLTSFHPLTTTISNTSTGRAVVGVAGLQPLTKTTSRDSTGAQKASSTNLAKSDSNQSIKSNKSTSSLKGHSRSSGSLKGLSSQPSAGLKSSAKRGKAILRLNEDPAHDEFEDYSEHSGEESHRGKSLRGDESRSEENMGSGAGTETRIPTEHTSTGSDHCNDANSGSGSNTGIASDIGKRSNTGNGSDSPNRGRKDSLGTPSGQECLESAEGDDGFLHEKTAREFKDENKHTKAQSKESGYGMLVSRNESGESLKNMYGGSFLLSQSTGMTRKLDGQNHMGKSHVDHDGIVYKPSETMRPDSGPKVTRANATQGSYQPDQSIFSNLQRNDSKYLSTLKKQGPLQRNSTGPAQHAVQRPLAGQAGPNGPRAQNSGQNFSSYLTSNQNGNQGQKLETRTQQRLWLQRENSLMDLSAHLDSGAIGNFSNLSMNKLMFAHNYNGSSTNVREAAWTPHTTQERMSGASVSTSNASGASSVGGATAAGNGGTGSPTGPHGSESSVSINNMLQNQNGYLSSIQLRTEFERLNREYVNVRRHSNPVAEMLSRMQRHDVTVPKKKSSGAKNAYGGVNNANSYKEFAPNWAKRAEDIGSKVNRLWQDALLSSTSSVPMRAQKND